MGWKANTQIGPDNSQSDPELSCSPVFSSLCSPLLPITLYGLFQQTTNWLSFSYFSPENWLWHFMQTVSFFPGNRLWHFMQIISFFQQNRFWHYMQIVFFLWHFMQLVSFQQNRLWYFIISGRLSPKETICMKCQPFFFQNIGFDISCKGDNMHEMSKPIFWKKKWQNFKMSSAAICTQHAKRYANIQGKAKHTNLRNLFSVNIYGKARRCLFLDGVSA